MNARRKSRKSAAAKANERLREENEWILSAQLQRTSAFINRFVSVFEKKLNEEVARGGIVKAAGETTEGWITKAQAAAWKSGVEARDACEARLKGMRKRRPRGSFTERVNETVAQYLASEKHLSAREKGLVN